MMKKKKFNKEIVNQTYFGEVGQDIDRGVGVFYERGDPDDVLVNLESSVHSVDTLLLEGLEPEYDGILKPGLVGCYCQSESIPRATIKKNIIFYELAL